MLPDATKLTSTSCTVRSMLPGATGGYAVTAAGGGGWRVGEGGGAAGEGGAAGGGVVGAAAAARAMSMAGQLAGDAVAPRQMPSGRPPVPSVKHLRSSLKQTYRAPSSGQPKEVALRSGSEKSLPSQSGSQSPRPQWQMPSPAW